LYNVYLNVAMLIFSGAFTRIVAHFFCAAHFIILLEGIGGLSDGVTEYLYISREII